MTDFDENGPRPAVGWLKQGPVRGLALCLAGISYWQLASMLMGAKEPWDADAYWSVAYPLSIFLSACAGPLFRRHAWLPGAALTLTQLPVIWLNTGPGPLWAAGFLILCVLALPAMGASWLASRIVRRRRH